MMGSSIETLTKLIERCERGTERDQFELVSVAVAEIGTGTRATMLVDVDAYMDAAIDLLPKGAVWRRYTDESVSFYAASPYNAKAQVRHDGFSTVPSLALVAAYSKALLASLLKAQGTEARRAETALAGSVHDGPVAKRCVQPTTPSIPRNSP